jgi:hypothetical protein
MAREIAKEFYGFPAETPFILVLVRWNARADLQ